MSAAQINLIVDLLILALLSVWFICDRYNIYFDSDEEDGTYEPTIEEGQQALAQLKEKFGKIQEEARARREQ